MSFLIYLCSNLSDSLPVLHEGRVKPFLTLAQESFDQLSLKNNQKESFCLLSFSSYGLEIPKLTIKDPSFKKLFNKDIVSYEELLLKKDQISSQYLKKIDLYLQIKEGDFFSLFKEKKFVLFRDFLQEEELKNQQLQDFFIKSEKEYKKKYGSFFLNIEVLFLKLKSLFLSFFMTLLAILLFFTLKKYYSFFFYISFFLILLTITFRVIIGLRGPVTNMYETLLFSSFTAFLFSLFLKKDLFKLSALIYTLLALGFLLFADKMVSHEIHPLVPVLRNNFWLSTHVTTVVSSYGAFALAWILAHYYLIKKDFSQEAEKNLHFLLFLGSALLSLGIILGAIWADQSWGRFWAWDPKETWSLIVLLFYIAILHAKASKLISPFLFIFLTATAFSSVLMAWFGVNYILASGLHSYGFSENGSLFLISTYFIQFVLLFFLWKRSS